MTPLRDAILRLTKPAWAPVEEFRFRFRFAREYGHDWLAAARIAAYVVTRWERIRPRGK